MGGEFFRTCPNRPWGSLSLPYNGYRVFPDEGKERPGRDADPSPPSTAVVMKKELYLYSPYRPYSLYRASVLVQGCPLHFCYFRSRSNTVVVCYCCVLAKETVPWMCQVPLAYMTEPRQLSLSIDRRFACMDWLYDQEDVENGSIHGTSFRGLIVCPTTTTTRHRKVDSVTLLQVRLWESHQSGVPKMSISKSSAKTSCKQCSEVKTESLFRRSLRIFW